MKNERNIHYEEHFYSFLKIVSTSLLSKTLWVFARTHARHTYTPQGIVFPNLNFKTCGSACFMMYHACVCVYICEQQRRIFNKFSLKQTILNQRNFLFILTFSVYIQVSIPLPPSQKKEERIYGEFENTSYHIFLIIYISDIA
jgi:uncharacterized membrane protein YecN with MAPEG domain